MKKIIALLICIVGLISCNSQELSQEEIKLIDEINLDHNIALEIKSTTKNNFEVSIGQADREMLFENFPSLKNYGKNLPKAVKIKIKSNEALILVKKFKEKLERENLIIYRSEENYGNSDDVITILKSKNKFEPLLFEATNAVNYDIYTPEIIERLKTWDQLYGVTLLGVGFDHISGEFKRKTSNPKSFADEIYKFCPDIVDQGVGDIEELEKILKESNEFFLWWD